MYGDKICKVYDHRGISLILSLCTRAQERADTLNYQILINVNFAAIFLYDSTVERCKYYALY